MRTHSCWLKSVQENTAELLNSISEDDLRLASVL